MYKLFDKNNFHRLESLGKSEFYFYENIDKLIDRTGFLYTHQPSIKYTSALRQGSFYLMVANFQ